MSKKILIVEDTKNIREIVAYMLRNRGHEVLEAADGDDGWKKAMGEKLDLVVLDAMLPGKSGFEICSDLKGSSEHKMVPVIMLTAITQDSDKTDDYWKEKSGADDFMSKPFKVRDLVDRIEKLLGVGGEEK
ncbi:MAG: response regulator transcription factor [Planctomycetota bacterium]|jgi:DNA-binding response OmpR family regulator